MYCIMNASHFPIVNPILNVCYYHIQNNFLLSIYIFSLSFSIMFAHKLFCFSVNFSLFFANRFLFICIEMIKWVDVLIFFFSLFLFWGHTGTTIQSNEARRRKSDIYMWSEGNARKCDGALVSWRFTSTRGGLTWNPCHHSQRRFTNHQSGQRWRFRSIFMRSVQWHWWSTKRFSLSKCWM